MASEGLGQQGRRRRVAGRCLRILAAGTALIAVTAVQAASVLAVYLGLTFHLSGQARPPAHPQTAVWLAHRWAGQPQLASAYRRLFGQLRADRVTYAFLHVGPLAEAYARPCPARPTASSSALPSTPTGPPPLPTGGCCGSSGPDKPAMPTAAVKRTATANRGPDPHSQRALASRAAWCATRA